MSINGDRRLMQIAREAVQDHGAIQEVTELAALLIILRDRDVKNLMEIGSEAGGTFYAWCQVTNPEGLKISLDLPTGASGSWNYSTPEAWDKRTKLMQSFAKDVVCISGDSHTDDSLRAVNYVLKGELLDFLFIDGDHTFYGVKTDYEMYSPFVKPGGIIAFHDIKDSQFHRHRGCMVADFWKTLKGKFKAEIRTGQQDWGGIGVVFV